MYIKFTELQIEGFQSIGKTCVVPLESQGVTLIKGINEYDDKASSNGSGKSSLVESICWCLFGKTSSGVSNTKNRYYKNGCSVTVKFIKNSESYSITRSIDHKTNGSGIKLIREDTNEDLSCRNKTDTDKLIRTTILPFTQDIFLSTIFLSQGFSGRLSILTPSARKERLEVLANIEEAVSDFKAKLTDKKSAISDQVSEQSKQIAYLTGQLELYVKEKTEIETLKQTSNVTVPDCQIDVLTAKLDKLKPTIKTLEEQYNAQRVLDSKYYTGGVEKQKQYNTIYSAWTRVCEKLNDIHVTSECPTCHRLMDQKLSDDIEAKLQHEATGYENQLKTYQTELDEFKLKVTEIRQTEADIKKRLDAFYKVQSATETAIREYNTAVSKNSAMLAKINRLSECLENITRLSDEIESLKSSYDEITISANVVDHMLKLITKDFRSFLLSEVVEKMNIKLKDYSSQLFENNSDSIQLSNETAKLEILLGDSLYESLSGGEKKKVDLALVLAQRDIALAISGFQCNLLILDEVLENCDEVSANSALSLLNTVASEIDSLYIISHNNYTIPVDRVLTITKHIDRVSTINLQ